MAHDDQLGHAHGVSAEADGRKLTIAFGLIVGFMAVEGRDWRDRALPGAAVRRRAHAD